MNEENGVRFGILGCADIAFRRFLPALEKVNNARPIFIAEEFDKSKVAKFVQDYELLVKDHFWDVINSDEIDAVYIPLPPALHYEWAQRALAAGKHVLVEKPATISYNTTRDLVRMAGDKGLALHENYMFQYHKQIDVIKEILDKGMVGDIRLIRASFGFPMRQLSDFRYNAHLGGGALYDAGGYAVRLAMLLLGDSVRIDSAVLSSSDEFDVDMYGSATLINNQGTTCQIGFGMDCHYQCSLEIWGNKGKIYTDRVFTAPDDYSPRIEIETGKGKQQINVEPDNHFIHSIEHFLYQVDDEYQRKISYRQILLQSKLIEEIIDKANWKRLGR